MFSKVLFPIISTMVSLLYILCCSVLFANMFYEIGSFMCRLDLGEGGKRDLNDMNQTLEEAGVLDGSVIWFCPDQTSFDDENDSTTYLSNYTNMRNNIFFFLEKSLLLFIMN
jgi:hypothetical protein